MAENKYQRIQNSNKLRAESVNITLKRYGYGIVTDVILSEDDNKDGLSGYIGAIKFKSELSEDVALPFDKNFINLPIKNETVELYRKISDGIDVGPVYYRRIEVSSNPNVSNVINNLDITYQDTKSKENSTDSFSEVKQTNIASTNNSNKSETIGFGQYFEPQTNIHKLKLYEGDSLIESRFGQSIRFSAYNNGDGKNRKFSPTIIIRNGENENSKKQDYFKSTEENIKEDGGIIAMTSAEYELQFDGGSEYSKIETKPESFKEYPNKLTGDQILINSGRIILSAKTGEMIFFSKKNYGFISDGNLSIDNKSGMFVKLGDEFKLTTNNQKISLLGGKGKIYLNTEAETEPIARAATLVNILKDLINEIKKQQFLTPSGPTKIGPENVPAFDTILSKLDTIKSTLNFTE